MADCMTFPKTADKFIEQYSFKDEKQEYTNGAELIPVFRVKQMMEHYFPEEEVRCKDCKHYLLDSGVMVLPCKIGDTVWGIRYHTGVPYIKQGTVSEMAYLDDMRLAIAVKFAPKYNTRGFWGVTIFATRIGGKDNG